MRTLLTASIIVALVSGATVAWAAGNNSKVEVHVTPLIKMSDDLRAIEKVLPETIATLKGVELGASGHRIEAAYIGIGRDNKAEKTQFALWVVFFAEGPNACKADKSYRYQEGDEARVSKEVARDFFKYCLR